MNTGFASHHPSFLPKSLEGYVYVKANKIVPIDQKKNASQGLSHWWKKIETDVLVHGQLLHPKKEADENAAPVARQKIGLFRPGVFYDEFVKGTEVETNKDGGFTLNYRWKHRPYHEKTNFVLKVFNDALSSEGSNIVRTIASFPLIKVPHKPDQSNRYDAGKLEVRFYEAQENFPLLQIEDMANRPQQSSREFNQKLIADVLKQTYDTIKGTIVRHFSPDEAQKIFYPNEPVVRLGADSTIDFILNGTYQAQFQEGKEKDEFINVINWDKYKKAPAPPLLPNASITLKKVDGRLHVKDVTIQLDDKTTVYTPDHPDFKKVGLYLFNSAAFIKGEGVDHLGKGHLMVGQLALSFFRHIKKHPIRELLSPHLDGVSEINRLGADVIFGDHGILTLSALPAAEINQLLKDTLSTIDFATFQPRDPITSEHRFAKAQKLFWGIVTSVVDEFFLENKERIMSDNTWYELYDMSQNLMKQSLPYPTSTGDGQGPKWVDTSELDHPNVEGRVEYDGHVRAIRPFISSREVPKDPEVLNAEIEKLKQFCRYAIFFSTFYHWAIHMSQAKWGTNLDVASLAPELWGSGKDIAGITDALKAFKQMEISKILVGYDAPTIVENKFGNINKSFIQLLLANKQPFADLGYDVTKIHSGIWI